MFRQGEVPDRFYLLEAGGVQEVGKGAAGADIQRRRTQAGDYVGHRQLMDDTLCQTTAKTTQYVQALVIGADDFKTLLAMYPRLEERLRRSPRGESSD